MVKIGDKIQIISDNENYAEYKDGIWTVNHIAYNIDEHPGYDESVEGQALIDCEGLGFSLYEYEFEVVE